MLSHDITRAPHRGRVTLAGTAIAAALVVALGLGAFQALGSSPWISKDERAHTGYIMALAHRRLPTVTTPIEVPPGAFDLEAAMAFEGAIREQRSETRRDRVWVANHPPGAYAPTVLAMGAFDLEDEGRSILVAQRFSNVIGAVVAIGFTALLARRLTGSATVAALAAGLCSVTPYLMAVTSFGLTDGAGLAASVGIVWAATRACSRGWDRSSTVVVAVLSVACGLTRLTALATAAAVVLVALLASSSRERRLLWRQAAAVLVPVVSLTGWFYALNTHRYGDPAASEFLLNRFGRTPSGSIPSVATDGSIWDNLIRTLLVGRRDGTFNGTFSRKIAPPSAAASTVAIVVIAASFAALVTMLWRGRSGRVKSAPDGPPASGTAEPLGWLLLLTALVVNWITTAQHVSGGGNPHARYFLIFIPAAACVVAASTVSFAGWIARRGSGATGWKLVGLLVALSPFVALGAFTAVGLDEFAARTFRPAGYFSSGTRLGPPWSRDTALGVAALAGATYLAALSGAWWRSADVGGQEVGLGLATDHQAGLPIGHEDHRRTS